MTPDARSEEAADPTHLETPMTGVWGWAFGGLFALTSLSLSLTLGVDAGPAWLTVAFLLLPIAFGPLLALIVFAWCLSVDREARPRGPAREPRPAPLSPTLADLLLRAAGLR